MAYRDDPAEQFLEAETETEWDSAPAVYLRSKNELYEAEMDRLQLAIDRVRHLHTEVQPVWGSKPRSTCGECGGYWPCRTITAIQ